MNINNITSNNKISSQLSINHDLVMKDRTTEEKIKIQFSDSMMEFMKIEMGKFSAGSLKKEEIQAAFQASSLNEMQYMNFLIQPDSKERCENVLIALEEVARKTDIQVLQLNIPRLYDESTYSDNFINDLFEKIKLIISNNKELSRIGLSCQRFDMRSCITTLGEALAGRVVDNFLIRDNQIGEAGAKELAPYLKTMTIEYLLIINNQIGNSGLEHIAKSLPKGLKSLHIDYNNITQEGVDKFFEILSGYAKDYPEYDLTLEGVNLNGNTLSENQLNYPEMKNSHGKIIRFSPEKLMHGIMA